MSLDPGFDRMKACCQRRIARRLEAARSAIAKVSATPWVLHRLTELGYQDSHLTQGQKLFTAAAEKVSEATERLDKQRAATAHLRQCRAEVLGAYQGLARTARAVFRHDAGALISLGLKGKSPGAARRMLTAAHTLFEADFYTNTMRVSLARHGYSETMLSQERRKLAEWQWAAELQDQCSTAYEQAKAAQGTALRALDEWWARFSQTARAAFAEDPQTLAQFGLVPRGPTKIPTEGRRPTAAPPRQVRPANLVA
jgi:hypothetical protein